MAPEAWAALMYFASTLGDETLSIQYACGVLAMDVSSGLPAPCAARMAAELGLT
ncbi:hypothetical protein I542_3714 [Mycobacteroides abscessus 1948]|uniref:Uncharacterized protein n=2 Tax=Mycobacteroides abscessus TaxID=36809 RepID=A0A829QL79_9MYCO|nr:hypothetical protein I542_3714 [Mycobacteroides abscessus 1948]EUA67627.1 hypothetical protein I540_5655 [Mycobacteroides abscessus subsp. bolletii 1513]SKT67173.1 Uncharacterised protein [Mycobacteroides abscessus subsp. abscessus]